MLVLGLVQAEIHFPESGSLKSKRKILKSIKDRLRSKFNVSVSEVDYQDKWQRSLLAVATVGNDRQFVNQVLDQVADLLEAIPEIQVLHIELDMD